MNLRILKKLSKRAAPLLLYLEGIQFGKVEHFRARRDGHTGTSGHDRKHWLRNRAVHGDGLPGNIVYQPRRQHERLPFIHMREPWHAWDGTQMVGWSSGYETREWEECTAWEHLEDIVRCCVTDYRQAPVENDPWGPGYDMQPYTTERLRNPRDVLRKAGELALARQAADAKRKAARDAQRNIGAELLQSVREIKAGVVGATHGASP